MVFAEKVFKMGLCARLVQRAFSRNTQAKNGGWHSKHGGMFLSLAQEHESSCQGFSRGCPSLYCNKRQYGVILRFLGDFLRLHICIWLALQTLWSTLLACAKKFLSGYFPLAGFGHPANIIICYFLCITWFFATQVSGE